MVLLQEKPLINEQAYPYTYWWESLRRKKHNLYEEKINSLLYGFQRWLKTPIYINFMFPMYYQHQLLDLQIYRTMQKLGDYTDEEVNEYKTLNPSIAGSIKAAFGTPFPKYGLPVGASIFAYMIRTRFNFVHVALLSAIPVLTELLYRRWDVSSKHEVLKFLEWDVESRKARSHLEAYRKSINQDLLAQFQNLFQNKALYDSYKEYLAYLNK